VSSVEARARPTHTCVLASSSLTSILCMIQDSHIHACMCTYMFMHKMYVPVYSCMYVCMYVFMYT
jgi:hypothetical protein